MELLPVIAPPLETALQDVKSISIADSPPSVRPVDAERQGDSSIVGLAISKLRTMIVSSQVDSDAVLGSLDDVISCELQIKFKHARNSAAASTEANRAVSALLRPIAQHEQVTLQLQDGRKVTGAEVLCTKVVPIEITPSGRLVDMQVGHAMRGFACEVDDACYRE
ncbi:MAG: hypothetical protein ACRCYV_02070 [Aeromonas sp.]